MPKAIPLAKRGGGFRRPARSPICLGNPCVPSRVGGRQGSEMSTADHGNTAAAHVLQIAQERRDGPLKSARRLSLSIVLAGVLALGASPTAGIAADLAVSEPTPRHIVTRWRVAKR